MKYSSIHSLALLSMFLLIGVTACASPASEKMVPQLPDTLPQLQKSIGIGAIIIGEIRSDYVGTQFTVGEAKFKNALLETLRQSNMFQTVYSENIGDLELQADIIAQQAVGAFTKIGSFVIAYKLFETATGEKLWEEEIISVETIPIEEEFSGDLRQTYATERAMKQNLGELIHNLSLVLEEIS